MAEKPDRTPERDERTGRGAAAQRMQRQQEYVDQQLRIAMERGDFDNLPGAGKPIKDLGSQHDPDWWIKRLIERENITGVLPPALQLRKDDAELDAQARPPHRGVGSTPRARGVQRARHEGPLHTRRRPATGHHAPRRRRRGRRAGGSGCASVARRRATSPPYDGRSRRRSPYASAGGGAEGRWSGTSVSLSGVATPGRRRNPGHRVFNPAQPQNRSGSASRTRCDVRVARHSSLLIGVHETASPFLRAGTVRQYATPDPLGTNAR